MGVAQLHITIDADEDKPYDMQRVLSILISSANRGANAAYTNSVKSLAIAIHRVHLLEAVINEITAWLPSSIDGEQAIRLRHMESFDRVCSAKGRRTSAVTLDLAQCLALVEPHYRDQRVELMRNLMRILEIQSRAM